MENCWIKREKKSLRYSVQLIAQLSLLVMATFIHSHQTRGRKERRTTWELLLYLGENPTELNGCHLSTLFLTAKTPNHLFTLAFVRQILPLWLIRYRSLFPPPPAESNGTISSSTARKDIIRNKYLADYRQLRAFQPRVTTLPNANKQFVSVC